MAWQWGPTRPGGRWSEYAPQQGAAIEAAHQQGLASASVSITHRGQITTYIINFAEMRQSQCHGQCGNAALQRPVRRISPAKKTLAYPLPEQKEKENVATVQRSKKKQRTGACDATLIFVVGPPGSGKTHLVRDFVGTRPFEPVYNDEKNVAWLRSGHVVVMGRWQGYHADGGSKLAGRLDGCDRLWNGVVNMRDRVGW